MEVSSINVSCKIPSFLDSSKRYFSGVSVFNSGKEVSGVCMMRPMRRCYVALESIDRFCDKGHLEYYKGHIKRQRKSVEKKVKVLKKSLSMLSVLEFGGGNDDRSCAKRVEEAREVLRKQLQQAKAEEKELKRKRKQEKAKLKALRMKKALISSMASLCSSWSSSDSECGDVIRTSQKRSLDYGQTMPKEIVPVTQGLQPPLLDLQSTIHGAQSFTQETVTKTVPSSPSIAKNEKGCEKQSANDQVCSNGRKTESNMVQGAMQKKRIEVCMGGKCKKSGATALLEEFKRILGDEGIVVGCKCMGRCRVGPNVRAVNDMVTRDQAEVVDDSVRTPANPLYLGVGLADVNTIVSNFFGENGKDG